MSTPKEWWNSMHPMDRIKMVEHPWEATRFELLSDFYKGIVTGIFHHYKKGKKHAIEISEKTLEYLDKFLHKVGAEAYYCSDVHLDMKDYDGAIKAMANAITWRDALMNGKLDYEPVFETDIKEQEGE